MAPLNIKSHLDEIRDGWWGYTVVDDPEKREDSFWLSPDGVWFNVRSAKHVEFASDIIHLVFKEKWAEVMMVDGMQSNDTLHRLGWVRSHGITKFGFTIEGVETMTEDQYLVLVEHFGRRHLTNGKTVKEYWVAQQINTGEIEY